MILCRAFPMGPAFAVLASAFLVLVFVRTPSAHADGTPFDVAVTPVPLSEQDPDLTRVGALTYRGGLVLESGKRRFGGISGLSIDPQTNKAVMVTDAGTWIDGDVVLEEGRLVGFRNARLAPLRDATGKPISGKSKADAEALLRWGDSFLVSFERDHRIWRYDVAGAGAPFASPAQEIPLPSDFRGIPGNKGLESLARLDETLVLMTERALDADGRTKAWMAPGFVATGAGAPDYASFRLETDAPFSPTDMAVLPDGDLLILERHYSPLSGVRIQVRRLSGSALAPGAVATAQLLARLGPELTIDNMEGLDVVTGPEGRIHLFMVSDDNFNVAQRTLLLMFELNADPN